MLSVFQKDLSDCKGIVLREQEKRFGENSRLKTDNRRKKMLTHKTNEALIYAMSASNFVNYEPEFTECVLFCYLR